MCRYSLISPCTSGVAQPARPTSPALNGRMCSTVKSVIAGAPWNRLLCSPFPGSGDLLGGGASGHLRGRRNRSGDHARRDGGIVFRNAGAAESRRRGEPVSVPLNLPTFDRSHPAGAHAGCHEEPAFRVSSALQIQIHGMRNRILMVALAVPDPRARNCDAQELAKRESLWEAAETSTCEACMCLWQVVLRGPMCGAYGPMARQAGGAASDD